MTNTKTTQDRDQVDVRGPRFAAWVTTAVIVATLDRVRRSAPCAAAVILGVQAVVFAIGAVGGPAQAPLRPDLRRRSSHPVSAPVTEREPVPPLKFAQLVGFVFAVVGAVGFAHGPATARAHRAPASLWSPRSSTPPSASALAASSTRSSHDSVARPTPHNN